jgi:predicted RND superfamily exporter protein
MAISITDEIHLLEHLQQRLATRQLAEGRPITRDEVRSALEAAIRDVQRPIVLTSLTTALGFLSYLSASMAPIRNLGLFIALGIMLAMVLSFTLIPALILVLPPSWLRRRARRKRSSTRGQLSVLEHLVVRRGQACLALGVGLTLASIPGLTRLTVQDSWISGLDPESDPVRAERDLNTSLWGSYRFDLVLDSTAEGYLQSSDGIGLVDRIVSIAGQGPHVGGVVSHLTHDRLVATTLGIHEPLSAISDQSLLRVAGLARFFRRISDLDQLLLPDASSARVRLFVKSADYQRARELDAYLTERLPPLLAHRPVHLHTSGDLPVAMVVVHAVVTDQLRSMALTLLGIGVLLLIALRNPLLAAALITPAAAAVVITLGTLGALGTPLGIASSMFSALSVGIGVDLALHLAHAYHRAYQATATPARHQEAMLAALATAGRAVRCNVAVLALGFSVLALSALGPNRLLGILLASTLVACFLSTLLLLPGLLERLAARGHLCAASR